MQHVALLRVVVLLTVLAALAAALGASWVRAKKPEPAAHNARKHHPVGARVRTLPARAAAETQGRRSPTGAAPP